MSRLPVRVRLTAAFAVAMVLVLAGAGLFVYLRLKSDLNESVTAGLTARATAVLAAGSASAGAAGDPEEGFALLLSPDGGVLDSAGGIRGRAVGLDELRRAAAGERILVERKVPGVEGTTRVLARAEGSRVVAVGQSLQDRDDTLGSLVASFAIGGPIAVLLASLVGYSLAAAGLRPVEAMRRRAQGVSLSHEDERLPLPAAHDEIRRLGETLNEMLGRLHRSFERERRFVADASHELRTPVAVIKAELEAALRGEGHDPQVREALVASLDECDHLAQLAEDLLVVARTSGGELPVRPERLELRELLDRVASRFADRAGERGRSVSVDAGEGQSVYADESRLRQALGNLVDNALRHGQGEVVLRARRAGPGLQLEVSDQGEGFAPDFAERAFERFARGDLARTRDGTGLGLSIVRAIAEAHGGRAELVPGAAATVRTLAPRRPSDHLRVISDCRRRVSIDGNQPDMRRRNSMKDKLKGAAITVAAIAALALGGTAIAGATGGGDDDKTDTPITGSALDRAKTVALDHIGGGKVTGTEVGDEEGAYEVEVTRADGSQVDVHLDKGFHVINQAADGDGGENESGGKDD